MNAGDQVGFTVEVKNTGTGTAKGVALSDPLPAGSGTGVTWAVDGSTGTPAKFVLAGAKGSQTLTLASGTLAAGADYVVHITATTSFDVSARLRQHGDADDDEREQPQSGQRRRGV